MIVHEIENELIKIWNLIVALSDQLEENRAVTAQLRAQADILKVLSTSPSTAYSPLTSTLCSLDQGPPFWHRSPLTPVQS